MSRRDRIFSQVHTCSRCYREFKQGASLAAHVMFPTCKPGTSWYRSLKRRVEEAGYAHEIEWASSIEAPETAEALWREYAWTVLNSGMKEQIARKIWEKVRPVVEGGGSASSVFGHAGKARAIDSGWLFRNERFVAFNETNDQLAWCESLPWIGGITKYHLAKNLGVDCAKPDRHLVRIAGAEGVERMCKRLAKETGDRIACVDTVIWRAANLGFI